MPNSIRRLPISEAKTNAWQNKVGSAINSNNVIAGPGIDVDYGPYGATVSVATTEGSLEVIPRGDFDMTQEYYPNHIVRVNPLLQYPMPEGNPNVAAGRLIPFGNTSQFSSSLIPLNPGLFICTVYVPPATANETWLESYGVANLDSGVIPAGMANSTRFYDFNVYYPVYPEIPLQYTRSVTIFDGVSTIIANQTFWKALPYGSIALNSCVNNAKANIFVQGFISGSNYDTRYLPFHVS